MFKNEVENTCSKGSGYLLDSDDEEQVDVEFALGSLVWAKFPGNDCLIVIYLFIYLLVLFIDILYFNWLSCIACLYFGILILAFNCIFW